MSLQVQVGTSPNAILFGQQRACTVTNLGFVTLYLGEDSTTTAGVDFPLPPGASVRYDDGAQVWGVIDASAPVVGQVQVLFDSDQVFSPAGSGARVVYDGSLVDVSSRLGTVPYRATPYNVYGSITVIIYAKTATNPLAGANDTTVSMYCGETIPTLPKDVPADAVGQGLNLIGQMHTASWHVNTTGMSATYFVGQPLFQATFPNVSGSGASWYIDAPGLTRANFGVRVLVNQYAVPSTIVTNSCGSALSSLVLTANTTAGATGIWELNGSASWYAGSAGGMNQASATTRQYWLPTLSGPVRVRVQSTQTGAAACTMTLYEDTIDGLRQWDTALVSSTAAGSLFGAATYGVWPTSSMCLQIVTAAGVSLANTIISISSGVQ